VHDPGGGDGTEPSQGISLPDPMQLLVDAVASLVDEAVGRVLSTSDRVTSAAQGKRLLAADDDAEILTDRLQRVVVVAVPILRTVARGARFTRVPWVLVASTAVSVAATVRSGVREVQVIGSLLAYRLEQTIGADPDPALVTKLALALYLDPRRKPDASESLLPLRRLLQRWLFKGAFGRDTRRTALKALDAAERLDLGSYVDGWGSSARSETRVSA
jgi:hypothetical protein